MLKYYVIVNFWQIYNSTKYYEYISLWNITYYLNFWWRTFRCKISPATWRLIISNLSILGLHPLCTQYIPSLASRHNFILSSFFFSEQIKHEHSVYISSKILLLNLITNIISECLLNYPFPFLLALVVLWHFELKNIVNNWFSTLYTIYYYFKLMC